MSRKFVATVVAASLAVAAIGNAPARADENLARAIAALVGAAIVGKVLTNQLAQREAAPERFDDIATRRYDTPGRGNRHLAVRENEQVRRIEPRPLPREVQRALLPGDCLRSYEMREARYRVFERSCLRQAYAFERSLPQACEVKFKTRNGMRHGYDARCLRRAGYQMTRR
jgi:hypothetical protein